MSVKESTNKPKIAMHVVMPTKAGGPLTSIRSIIKSDLKEKYDFVEIVQNRPAGGFINFRLIKELSKAIKREQPDIVQIVGLQSTGLHMLLACKLAKVKNTLTVIHGIQAEAIGISRIKKIVFERFIEPFILRNSRCVFGVSKYVTSTEIVQSNMKNYHGHIYNIPPKIECEEGKFIRQELGINDDDVIFVSVGRITREKGYHILCEAIKNIDNIDKMKFIIVGDGEFLTEFKRQVANKNNNVFFLGQREDIDDILSGCNVFILPTLHETLSIALLEASQHSLALIASNVGGIPEIVENGTNGFLIEAGDWRSIKNKVEFFMENSFEVERMGENAKERVRNNFSESSIAEQLDLVYKNLLDKR